MLDQLTPEGWLIVGMAGLAIALGFLVSWLAHRADRTTPEAWQRRLHDMQDDIDAARQQRREFEAERDRFYKR